MRWDVFCRVIDNYGDAGVCWRLVRALAADGDEVRLWIDDPAPLRWMAPGGAAGVTVLAFGDAAGAEPGDVVIEAFGCDPPAGFVARMAQRRPAPVWINLEYLSAEPYVERSHGLRSPQLAGPGAGLDKWFFYPGFNDATGGLLPAAEPPADRHAWLSRRGWGPRTGERVVLLFCYDNPALPRLLADLARAPTLLLAAPGPAQAALPLARDLPAAGAAALRGIALPLMPQDDFDRLLACTDLNIVRGEDSATQAGWSGRPMLWQLYPQHDGAHGPKLDAFLDRFGQATGLPRADGPAALMRAWNGLGPWPDRWPDPAAWRAACERWRDGLRTQQGLIDRLRGFVSARR